MQKVIKINEGTIKKMVSEAISRLMESSYEDHHPSVYVGTYGKYNNGSLQGKWVDLTQFNNRDEFYAYCNKLHGDEPDGQRELMFQDYEYIPDIFIGECWINPRFWEYMKDESQPADVKEAVADYVSDVDEYFNQIENISIFPECKNMADVAYDCVKEFGFPQNPEIYFDFEQYGKEMSWDGPFDKNSESIYQEFGVEEDDDEALGEEIVSQIYGDVKNLGDETIKRYFDFEKYGNTLDTEGTYIPYENGYIELY